MKEYPLCSIMIPTYNQAHYLRKTIESALAQDYPNLEVIVSDDHSSDDTVKLLESFDDARLKWHSNSPNLGRVANYRDSLYAYARGKWVINLDGDDFFIDPSFISSAIKIAEADPDAVIVFADRLELEDPIGDIVAMMKSRSASAECFSGIDYLLSWPRKDKRIHHLTALYLREKAIATDFYRMNIISSDYESLFRLMLHGNVWHVPATVAVWRYHSGNASVNKNVDDKISDLDLFGSVAAYAADNKKLPRRTIERWRDKNIARKYYTFLLKAYKNKDFSEFHAIDLIMRTKYRAACMKVRLSPVTWLKILYHVN